MYIYLTAPAGPIHTGPGASFGTFTTKTDISPIPIPVIQGGTLIPGSKIWLKANGEFSTTGTPTLSLGFGFGTIGGSITTDVAVSSAITTGSGAAAWMFDIEWFGTCATVGTTGTVVGAGILQLGTSLTTVKAVPIPITQALRTVTVDTTIARAVSVSAAWGTSSASNTVKVNSYNVLISN